MKNRHLPAAPEGAVRSGVRSELSPLALERWNARVFAASDDANTISIFDPIGYDPWTGDGVTAKRISAALRSLNGADVRVSVNSPGGDMFEGLAIYNLFREYEGQVTMKVLGVAASAASVITMAGDEVQIARSAFLMIHNAWVVAVGNRNDLREMADTLEPFDRAMADIYAARTGQDIKAIQQLLDNETWIGGSDAVSQGFADDLLASDAAKSGDKTKASARMALHRIDAALISAGLSRAERRSLINEFKSGMPSAAGSDDTPGAVVSGTPSATDQPGLSPNQQANFEAALFGLVVAPSTVNTGETNA